MSGTESGTHRLLEWRAHYSSAATPEGTVFVSFSRDARLMWDGDRLVYADGASEIATSRVVYWGRGATLLVERQGRLLRVWVSAEVEQE